jgi:hypothetical protein
MCSIHTALSLDFIYLSVLQIETGGTKPGFANIVVGTNFNARASPAVVR